MTFLERKRYVFDPITLEALSPKQWARYFNYEPTRRRSEDGQWELNEQRVLGEDGKLDWIRYEVIELSTGDKSKGSAVAFSRRERADQLERFLRQRHERFEQKRRRDETLAQEIRAGTAQRCPHCDAPVHRNRRYPDYLCSSCANLEKRDEHGRKVTFTNASISGGLVVHFWEDGEISRRDESQTRFTCLIEGKRYIAREAHFGGVVLRPEQVHP